MKSLLRRAFGRARPASLWDDEDPIRSELFSIERLEQHAESLAANQPISTGPAAGKSLVDRLADNERVLLAAYRSIAKAADEGRPITPAAEWLLDNYHLVEEQVREVRDRPAAGLLSPASQAGRRPAGGLSPRLRRRLGLRRPYRQPVRSGGADAASCAPTRRVQPLTIGELWAVAITLRIVLVENLRRSAERIMSRRSAREEADALADRLLGVNDTVGRSDGAGAPTSRRRSPRASSSSSSSACATRIPKRRPRSAGWRSGWRAQGTNADELVRREHQRQGATNVTVRNIITSMRLISDVDWAKLFESVSPVDDILRGGSDLRRDGFRDPRSLPHRDRADRPRHSTQPSSRSRAARCRSPRRRRHAGDGDRRRQRSRLLPDRRRTRRLRARARISVRLACALRRRFIAPAIAGYVGSVSLHGRHRARPAAACAGASSASPAGSSRRWSCSACSRRSSRADAGQPG